MTDSKESFESSSDMDPRFENIAAYVLDALDSNEERRAVESLIESDSEAFAEFSELSETAGLLAVAVPPVSPPSYLKANLLRLAAEESPQDALRITSAPTLHVIPWWQRAFQSGLATSAVAAVLLIVVTGVLGYQNNHLGNEIDILRTDLSAEAVVVANLQSELSNTMADSNTKVASMKSEMAVMEDEFGATTKMVVHQEEIVSKLAIANDALKQALRDQSWLTYVSMKEGYRPESWLASNTQSTTAQPSGMIAVRVVGNDAVFQVHGFEQPSPGFAYTLWLIGNGDPRPVAQFDVSEIGSATVAFSLPAPLKTYSSIMVTQEQVNRTGNDPTGTMVIFADTN